MHAGAGVLAVVGSVCMTLALVLAWCQAGVRSSRFVKKYVPNPQYLLKAHLDFLMMTGLLFIFFWCSSICGLRLRWRSPDLPQKPATPFGAVMIVSFTATTVGYGGAAWYVAHAILHTGL